MSVNFLIVLLLLNDVVVLFISGPVYLSRAGINKTGENWRSFLLPCLPWFLMTAGKCLVWEVVLIVWLVQGRPEPVWKAVARTPEGREVRRIVRVHADARQSVSGRAH